MSTIAQVESNAAQSAYEAQQMQKKNETQETASSEKKYKVNGKTIGEPKLSEKALKYYEELRKKYSNMDFILVSADKKEQAKAQAGNYANANRMVVLIDEEKIEKMAEDEEFRKQYESIISSAATKLPSLQKSLASSSAKVKTYGIQVNDGGNASFFAVIDKSLAAQRDRIAKRREDKKEAAKQAEKKKKAEKAEERAAERSEKKKADQTQDGDTVMITANSVEELLKKIDDYVYGFLSDSVQTEAERMLGQSIDYHA